MKTLVPLLCAALLPLWPAAASAAKPKEVYLGDVVSPRAALHGKTFRLRPGQKLRLTHLQRTARQGRAIYYFEKLVATPARTLYHGAMALTPPPGSAADAHYRQETFSVLRSTPVGTVIRVNGSRTGTRDWTLSFKIVVVE